MVPRSSLRHRLLTGGIAGLLAVAVAAPVSAASAAPSATPPTAGQVFARMSIAERVGQLLMVGCPSMSVSSACLTAIRSQHVGAVILDGTSTLSIAGEHAVTAGLQRAAPASTRLIIATDQEGGYVRRMQGPGFTDYSTALTQGTWYTSWLQHWATTWGTQLRQAGITVDLAPVLDTVPAGVSNAPIGALDREYGHTTSVVTTQGTAVLRGLMAGGVDTTIKHFPGLGRVHRNTDTSSGVTDTVTTTTDPSLRPFAAGIAAGTAFVMVSTAIYTRIDATRPAAFSHAIVTDLLRTRLGFRGVVISDDLGAAKQVSGYPVGDRAVRFLAAGGDMVLTVNVAQASAMASAIRARMAASPAFTKQVDAAVLRVLQAKRNRGLLH